MEVAEIYYKAKDGKIFTDPLKCEEYEKTIGILPGSVGDLIQSLEELEPKTYIFGVVLVKEKDTKCVYSRCTVCCDNMLEDFVSVGNLKKEQRYIYETAENFIEVLKKTDKDYSCQWMILFSENIDLKTPGIMANYNVKVWDKKK